MAKKMGERHGDNPHRGGEGSFSLLLFSCERDLGDGYALRSVGGERTVSDILVSVQHQKKGNAASTRVGDPR